MMFSFDDLNILPDPFWDYGHDLQTQKVPLVIDNGSHNCKAGWACDEEPKLIFRNLISKARVKKEGDFNGCLIGNDILSLENMKWNLKTQFDKDVVTHFEAQEQIFDYAFSHLGINTECSINHPLVITEAICNPNPFRQSMSELLFECYRIPQVAYGIDSMFSFNYNMRGISDGIVISSGFAATHVVPIRNGRIDAQNCKRINVGGMNSLIYMQKLLQLKHPGLALSVTVNRAQELVRKHTYMASHYDEELAKWNQSDFSKKNTHVIQLPYIKPEPIAPKDPEKEKEKRIRQGRRLQELNAKKREEKLAYDEDRHKMLLQVLELQKTNPSFFKTRLKENSFETAKELLSELEVLALSIRTRKEKIALQSIEDGQPQVCKPKTISKNPTDGMTSEEKESWVDSLKRERTGIFEKRKLRNQRRQELSNRKSHASKERMRILTKLAEAENSSKRQKYEDTFGMNDEDWEVYKYISKEGSDSEIEQEQDRLNEIETLLSEHDLDFGRTQKPTELPVQDLSVYYQLRLQVERIRIPEVIFQPCLLGLEQAGLAETLDYVLKKYPTDVQDQLVQNIFITGGNTKFQGFKTRLENEIRAIRPFNSTFGVYSAGDPELDAWHGARHWVNSVADFSTVSLSRQDYEEGGEGVYCQKILLPCHLGSRTDMNKDGLSASEEIIALHLQSLAFCDCIYEA
eukprot:gene15741-17327_t